MKHPAFGRLAPGIVGTWLALTGLLLAGGCAKKQPPQAPARPSVARTHPVRAARKLTRPRHLATLDLPGGNADALPWKTLYLGSDLPIAGGGEPEWPIEVELDVDDAGGAGHVRVLLEGAAPGFRVEGDVTPRAGGAYDVTGRAKLVAVEPLGEEVPRLRVRPVVRPAAVPPGKRRLALVKVRSSFRAVTVQEETLGYVLRRTSADPAPPPDAGGGTEEGTEDGTEGVAEGEALVETLLESDVIKLLGNDDGDEAGIMIHAQASAACVKELVYRTPDEIAVGNLTNDGTCMAEVCVYSVENALELREKFPWTDAAEEHDIPLRAMETVPVKVWILYDPKGDEEDRVKTNVLRANQIFSDMRCGMLFDPVEVVNVSAEAEGLTSLVCSTKVAMKWYDSSRLNVYYVDGTEPRGAWCGDKMICILTTGDNETLAHELGHALGLDHVNDYDLDGDGVGDLSEKNLMQSGGSTRDSLTAGQAFRCNVIKESVVNSSSLIGSRTGPTRKCTDDEYCPSLGFDL